MSRRRRITIAASTVAVLLFAWLAYLIYPTTTYYRRHLEQQLSDQLNMTVTIERVRQKSKIRILENVTAVTKSKNVDIFHCERAEWSRIANRPRTVRALKLVNGRILVGEDQWRRDDYKLVLESSLGHDFAQMGLTDIDLDNIDLQWRHPQFTFSAESTSGRIDFDEHNTGHAVLTAPNINGSPVPDPIRITAEFTPGQSVTFHHVTLDIARSPLAALALDPLVGGPVTSGAFRGSVIYRDGDRQSVQIQGAIENAQLGELTRTLPNGPFEGRVDLAVDLAEVHNKKLDVLRFNGSIHDLHLGKVTAALNMPTIDGTIDLRVHNAVIEQHQLTYLSAAGHADHLPLDTLTQLLGKGTITGSLDITVNAFQIVDGDIASANVILRAVPPADAPGTIDRDILKHLSELALGFDATQVIPDAIESVEYTELGAELELAGDRLHIRGTHGPTENRILTINLLGASVPVVTAPDESYDIHDLLERIRQKLADTDRDKLKQWWKQRAQDQERN